MTTSPTKRNAFRLIESTLGAILEPADIIEFSLPNTQIEGDEHVEDNHVVQTPSLVRIEDAELKVLTDAIRGNEFFINKLAFDPETGGFRPEADYKFNLIAQQLAPDHRTPVKEWILERCHIKTSAHEAFTRSATENQVETLTIAVWKMRPRSLV